jgi:hypothetical protein
MSIRQSTDEQAEKSASGANEHWDAKYHEEDGNAHVLFTRSLGLFPTG